ncbi:MAG: hypothetical protein JWR69_920 [Pedosphaera sp.]|nr:hypothetical protein [Pedosphaera sp.]
MNQINAECGVRSAELWQRVGHKVIANHHISDSPFAEPDAFARKGQTGRVVDYDECSGLLFVDFGKGAIGVLPEEIR